MIALLLARVALGAITLEAPPQVGVEVPILVTRDDGRPAAGATVRALVHPDLPDAAEVAIGVTDARGRVLWTPRAAGRVTLRADDELQAVLVPWPSPPTGAVVLLALLVFAGLGAVTRGLVPPRA